MSKWIVNVLAVSATWAALAATARAQDQTADQWLAQPVGDEAFATYLDFFAYNPDLPFETQVLPREGSEGLEVEHITFQSTPGERVSALLFRPDMAGSSERAMVLLHGGVANGKDEEWMKQFSRLFARSGWVVLAIDMKYYGERRTDLFQTYTLQEKHERLYNERSTYLSWMAQNVKDAGRSFDFLTTEHGIDPARVVVVGISRGAVVGTIIGGADERFAAVVLIHGGHMGALGTGHLPAACPANYIGRISPRPLFMLNGENDTYFLMDSSVLPLQRLARDPTEFRRTDSGHAAITEEDMAFLLDWLRETVP